MSRDRILRWCRTWFAVNTEQHVTETRGHNKLFEKPFPVRKNPNRNLPHTSFSAGLASGISNEKHTETVLRRRILFRLSRGRHLVAFYRKDVRKKQGDPSSGKCYPIRSVILYRLLAEYRRTVLATPPTAKRFNSSRCWVCTRRFIPITLSQRTTSSRDVQLLHEK